MNRKKVGKYSTFKPKNFSLPKIVCEWKMGLRRTLFSQNVFNLFRGRKPNYLLSVLVSFAMMARNCLKAAVNDFNQFLKFGGMRKAL